MNVEIPADLAQKLVETAHAAGGDPEQLAITVIRRELDAAQHADEVLAPIREAFRESGLSEDAAVALFEAEKHAARIERRRDAS